MDSPENEEKPILEAGTVYLLMKKGFPISRNVRAQWILEHLDTVIKIQNPKTTNDETPELKIISIIPKDHSSRWSDDTSHQYHYRITSSSSVVFLAHKYRMVFCLDLSPSLSTIDIQRGEVVVDEVCMATKQCLENVSKPFTIPGSKKILHPEIYVTIIVHSPFFTNPPQQVLVQGWLISSENITYLMQFIEKRLSSLEENIANAESERSSEIFEDNLSPMGMTLNSSNSLQNLSVISPEASFINMLRYGILALTLLPEHSCAHLVIVSDGIVGTHDVYVLDSVIQQLRASTIACSFLHLGSAYHPHCANGLVPYQDLLCFLAAATLGCYMTFIPQFSPTEDTNIYHRNFLFWQLYRTVPSEQPIKPNFWHTDNSLFYGHQPQLLRKKQIDNKVICSLSSLLCCRLRDGYLIKRVSLKDGFVEICFILPWKTHVFLEYFVSSPWPPKTVANCNTIQYTITVEAPYEFLHDITCLSKKPLKSQYRQNVVSRFWATLTALTENDTMLEHFSWFPEPGWTWYNVPDTIRSGMPVFYLPAYPSATAVQLSDAVCPQFGKIWKPVASLDSNQWARWMHSQRVTLILTHDRPLPKYLHQANQSGRFQCIQCRQGAAALYAMLKNWATFVLVENHSYVQFIYRESEKPPVSFSVIRINCKALCVVLHVAFAGGTEGVVRHNVVMDLVERLSKLTLPNRPTEMRETPCCTIIDKSLERILIRYERMPTDFNTVVFPDGTQPVLTKNFQLPGGVLTTTLSRYLYHFRWLWNVKRPFIQTIPGVVVPRLNTTAIARILSTITKMRLIEGFNFAYSAAGIINMVLEVQMLGSMNDYHPCVIQYIIFPPHTISNPGVERDSESDEETDEGTADGEACNDDNENHGDYQIVTEVWIEPQCGRVKCGQSAANYMDCLSYHHLPDAISRIDEECINALLTLEHLSLLSQIEPCETGVDITNGYQYQNNSYNQVNRGPSRRTSVMNFSHSKSFLNEPSRDESIEHKLFNLDPLSILPKCQQAELLFSMFVDGPNFAEDGTENTNCILLEGLMDHMKQLHNKEIILNSTESQKFTEMLFKRPRDISTPLPFSPDISEKQRSTIRWRCFIKGISTTHIILTILPSTESDIRILFTPPHKPQKHSRERSIEKLDKLNQFEDKFPSSWFSTPKKFDVPPSLKMLEFETNLSSRTTTAESTPKADRRRRIPSGGPKPGLILPVYVYDCSLAFLIEVLVNKLSSSRSKDIYQNNTFSVGQHVHEDFINLKSSNDCKSASPEPKSEDSDNCTNDQRSLLEHCKLLNLAHCHCFVVAVYKSLSLQLQLSYEDMEAAVEQCEEALIEINITDYLKTVCKHLNPSGRYLNQSGTHLNSSNLHRNSSSLHRNSSGTNLNSSGTNLNFSGARLNSSSLHRNPSSLPLNLSGTNLNSSGTHLNSSPTPEKQEIDYTTSTCVEFQPLHNLIKDKFRRIIQVAFKPVPAHPEFYYCSPIHNPDRQMEFHRSDSDEDLEGFTFPSEPVDCKIDGQIKTSVSSNQCATWPNSNIRDEIKLLNYDSTESLISDLREDDRNCKEQPLFLQLNCSVHSKASFSSIPVKLLPTCFSEIEERLDNYDGSDINNVKITLDIICLNLPKEVLEVSLERVGLRTTSYCSASPAESIRTESESSPGNDTALTDDLLVKERIAHLPAHQHDAISTLNSEIEWLLKDEIATALLDTSPPTEETLEFVAKHVAESNGRTSCHIDKVPLQFVFPSANSAPKFYEEFIKMEIDRYTIKQLGRFLYFVKDEKTISNADDCSEAKLEKDEEEKSTLELDDSDSPQDVNSRTSRQDSGDPPGCQSEISSIGERPGTDDGYEGDSSNSEDDCCWLVDLDKRRDSLPNFWLILQVHKNYVDVYFHCRFLEFASPEVDRYRHVQKMVVSQISAICRRVNQYLLLESLHDTRNCDALLEPESHEDHSYRADSTSESGIITRQESLINMIPGMFRCSVVWEVTFFLHPRLKTGPGRSGLSRGIKALHVVLQRFSVNNRSNMFVYRENNSHVFYLRLHEQTGDGKPLQNKLSESDERLMVSRSSSVASLSQSRTSGLQIDQSKMDDTRPRVRSFGEKDSDYLNKSDDSIVLMVHGISEPGLEVRQDLVQVLHNRLDDAVLEVLSVMLARNPMCKLTPADVHFIQKPYRPPESYVQFSVSSYYFTHMEALAYYLRQNILQFLYIPKYTDQRSHYHLQDYSQPEGSSKRVPETDIFLNNQSQASGNKGIACIAMAIDKNMQPESSSQFPGFLSPTEFKNVVSTQSYQGTSKCASPDSPLEFRIWKQGRVNLETLVEKLKAAIKHATWDLVVEYLLLPVPLTVISTDQKKDFAEGTSKETSVSPKKEGNLRKLAADELGEIGELHEIYHKTLPTWFQFALDMGVPSVKKHTVTIKHRHSISTIVRELQNLIRINAPETSTKAFVLRQNQPFLVDDTIDESTRLPFRLTANLEQLHYKKDDDKDELIYVPCEFGPDDQKSYTKAVIVARNFNQWKASYSDFPEPELLMPKDQKLLQKFNPLIQESKFIPRQRLLLAKVESNQFIIYMYNWSKERSEKLIKQTTNLASWLSARSTLFSSIILQKMGIFHHQPLDNYHIREESSSPYQITDFESLSKFPLAEGKDWPRRSGQNKPVPQYSWDRILGQAMRDAKPSGNYPSNISDPVVRGVYDLQDLHQREKKGKEDITRLYSMWQSRSAAPSIPMPGLTLQTFKQYSRLIHYCHTPILFLPQWRLQSAATRDHSLTPPSSVSPVTSQVVQPKKTEKNAEKMVNSWHQQLCSSMLSEYKQYLQLLGFLPIQIDGKENPEDPHQTCYLKKSMLGGILVFEIHLVEPFFIVKLHTIECNRLQTKSSAGLINQFMLSFVDACDKIKINMHLHSFTYDFHLRCIHSYIAGTGQWSLQQGYHLTHFLDDFIKYYSKAPNFARNLVYSDVVNVSNLTTPAQTLYSYLLSHDKTYGMQVFGMTSDSQDTRDSEYVLGRLQSTPLVSYCDAQDTKYTDDFTVALIVSKQDQLPQIEKSEITLKFYLILTSKRELYPKREVENNKLGKFRTVYSVVKTTSGSQVESFMESGPTTPTPSDKSAKDDTNADFEYSESNSDSMNSIKGDGSKNDDDKIPPTPPPVPSSPLMAHQSTGSAVTPEASPHLMQIRQESVNYLGYYSSHEQLMQQLIISQARAAKQHITNMIERGTLHCRTHLLWNKLLENKSTMSYGEFMELKSLARVETLSTLDARLSPLVNQPITWYQTLAKVLQNKYQEHHKQFSTADGNVTHHLILHPSYLQAFMMLTIDLHTSRGELCAVYRKSAETTSTPFNLSEIHSLIEGFVNACCFHLWMGLYSQ